MATGSNFRVGDADRDATATQLREHYAAGRLTLDELNERLEQTFTARTGADLSAVMRDLPSLGSPWASATAGGPAAGSGQPGAPLLPGGQQQWGQGGSRRGFAAMGAFVPLMLGLWALLLLGGAFGFGIGGGRPFGIVLLFAALAMIRRMFGGRGRGRPGRRCGRRW